MNENIEDQIPNLDRIKRQYKALDESLEGQKIIDSKDTDYVVNHCCDHFQRHRHVVLAAYPFAIVALGAFMALFGTPVAVYVFIAVVLLLGLFCELWLTKQLSSERISGCSLIEMARLAYSVSRAFLAYYLILTCFVFLMLYVFFMMMDVPDYMDGMLGGGLALAGGVCVAMFLFLYVPVCRRCKEVLKTVGEDALVKDIQMYRCSDIQKSENLKVLKSENLSVSVRVVGFAVLCFAIVTACMKLLHLPGGTLMMLFAGVLAIVYVVLQALSKCGWLRVLLMVVSVLGVYLVMALVNKWPPFCHNSHYALVYAERPQGDMLSSNTLSFWEVETAFPEEGVQSVVNALCDMGVRPIVGGSIKGALLSVCVSDTSDVAQKLMSVVAPFIKMERFVLSWSHADAEGLCQLYLLRVNGSGPVMSSGQMNEMPMIERAVMYYYDSVNVRLKFFPTEEARKVWQSVVFGCMQSQAPVHVAAVLNGNVLCCGEVDNEYLGYQRLSFKISNVAALSPAVLEEIVRN